MKQDCSNLTVVRYSGTSYKKFFKCSYIDDKLNVYFDKSLEPKHEHRNLFHTSDIREALVYALICSKNDYAVILKGYLKKTRGLSHITLEPFPISGLYVFNLTTGMKTFNPFTIKNIESVLIDSDYVNLLNKKIENKKEYIS